MRKENLMDVKIESNLEKIKDIIAKQYNIHDFSENGNFVEDYNMDSLDLLSLITTAEEVFGITVEDEEIVNLKNFADLRHYVFCKSKEDGHEI